MNKSELTKFLQEKGAEYYMHSSWVPDDMTKENARDIEDLYIIYNNRYS